MSVTHYQLLEPSVAACRRAAYWVILLFAKFSWLFILFLRPLLIEWPFCSSLICSLICMIRSPVTGEAQICMIWFLCILFLLSVNPNKCQLYMPRMCNSSLRRLKSNNNITIKYYVACRRRTNLDPVDSLFWQVGDDVIPPCRICCVARHAITESINDSCPIDDILILIRNY